MCMRDMADELHGAHGARLQAEVRRFVTVKETGDDCVIALSVCASCPCVPSLSSPPHRSPHLMQKCNSAAG